MSETFTYHGVELPYFWHLYNLTMMNERAVEIAIATRWLEQMSWEDQKNGIEVGNVMGHYSQRQHIVIDRDEPAAWYQELAGQMVNNHDILAIHPVDPPVCPWVLSISTIEHTEDPVAALGVLHELVAPGGKLLVTFPTGVRDELDYLAGWTFDQWCTIARTEDGWEQTPEIEIRPYGPWANSVFIGEWERPA